MPTTWTTPKGEAYRLYSDMLRQPHLLIAGATGSGKSVLLNGLIATALYESPAKVGFILIDPKLTELGQYARLPHTIYYGCKPAEIVTALEKANALVDQRLKEMKKAGLRLWQGAHVYVIIDEFAPIMTDKALRKQCLPLVQRLGLIARAAGVSMIACTQTVKADVLPTTITCNFDARVALRTSTAQQSRMIVDRAGCELFPSPAVTHRAQCFYRNGADLTCWNVPYVPESELARLCSWWMDRSHAHRSLF